MASRVLDKMERTQKRMEIANTDFLTPHQRRIVQQLTEKGEPIHYIFTGGYEGAERQVIVFAPDFISFDEEPCSAWNPIAVLHVKAYGTLTHRDYLGALMGLGIKREKIGDILIMDESCSILVIRELAEYICANLIKVGKIRVDVTLGDLSQLQKYEPKFKLIKCTVASLRLDSVISSAFGVSRSKMSEYIRGQKVTLNWEPVEDTDTPVKEGDTLSVKGMGRAVLDEVGGSSKKDRIFITIKRFI